MEIVPNLLYRKKLVQLYKIMANPLKQLYLIFSKVEGVVHFNSDYGVIEQHILAKKKFKH